MRAVERGSCRRRGLLAVLLLDATCVAALGCAAGLTRCRPAGPGYRAVAVTAAASLLPGAVAVGREWRAHRPGAGGRHRATGTVLLFGAGVVVNTVGTLRTAARFGLPGRGRGRAPAVNAALAVGGAAIGVPYLALVRALHR
ncbi:hypothetical protein [Kineococcus sp. SYSU DK003]|uniref:hypothetical protein n=1 Tax=Kineococcus sp. SYSU DK003 TaxID=3383124 RepID=UPI003D7DB7FD